VKQEVLVTMDKIESPVDRYLYLRELYNKNFDVYFDLLISHTESVLPYIYTPTVGEICQRYHELRIQTRGLYLTAHDKGSILARLKAWPNQSINCIVITDGERILGLGDLGTGGMGISEGKITLYTAAAGLDPHTCLPVMLDVGTNNQRLLDDSTYPGLRQPRLTGPAYYELLDEFMAAVETWRPHCLIQFEDFGNTNAFHVLDRYRGHHCCFNDDIQGTACVALAGLLAALSGVAATETATAASGGGSGGGSGGVAGQKTAPSSSLLEDQRILFFGAGEAGTGIGELIAQAISHRTGRAITDARKQCFFIDSRGLVTTARLATGNLQPHKRAFAQDLPDCQTLLESIKMIQPTVLLGVSTIGGAFDEQIVRLMGELNARPIIFPLSNPTSLSECTFAQAMEWTEGRAIFASGSPFAPHEVRGKIKYPAQANNAYIFPAIGHAAILTKARCIPDEVFLEAAAALAELTSPDLVNEQGQLFPRFRDILAVSEYVMVRLCSYFVRQGLGTMPSLQGGGRGGNRDRKEEATGRVAAPDLLHAMSPSPAAPDIAMDENELLEWRGITEGAMWGPARDRAMHARSKL
jgi:malate dehydrogenase (oxaloacetate-decarboxylating)(NADP+)